MDGVSGHNADSAARDPLYALLARLSGESGFSRDSVERARGAIELHLACRARENGTTAERIAERAAHERAEYSRIESLVAPPETWLFRAPESFAWLRGRARSHAAANRGFRALLVGAGGWCEPCSAAAAILDGFAGAPRDVPPIEVIAVDRDETLFARPMRFSGMELRGGVPQWAERFLPPAAAAHGAANAREASPEVAACLRSARATVDGLLAGGAAARAAFGGAASFDAVFFRNVAIYLDDAVRTRAFAGLARLLADDGALFVGHAEVEVAARATGLASVDASGVFALVARRRADGTAPARGDAVVAAKVEEPRGEPREEPRVDPRVEPREERRDESPRAARTPAPPPRDAAWHLAEAVRHEEAGDSAAARAAIAKALYLDPRHEEALLAAARLAEAAGDGRAAERFRARALRSHLDLHRSEDRA